MIILGTDTTGTTLSVAVSDGDKALCELYLDVEKKHAEAFMPAVDSVLRQAGLGIQDVELFACSVGPGSFTGIRIGIAAVAAMAQATGRPAAAVGTLDALIANAAGSADTVCAVMDARRGEVYTKAVSRDGVLVDQCAMPLDELLDKLPPKPVLFVGDAAVKCKGTINGARPGSLFLPDELCYQRAASVCRIGHALAKEGSLVDFKGLRPVYLRKSQAERLRGDIRRK